MTPWQKTLLAGGSAVAVAASIVKFHEGDSTDSYRDIVGVWTVCNGHTATAGPGQHKTPEECLALLQRDLAEHDAGLTRCIGRDMPTRVHAAMLSLAFNVGVPKVCHSGTANLLRTGQWDAACRRLPLWAKAGGLDCADPANRCGGIVKRREAEMNLCLGVA